MEYIIYNQIGRTTEYLAEYDLASKNITVVLNEEDATLFSDKSDAKYIAERIGFQVKELL